MFYKLFEKMTSVDLLLHEDVEHVKPCLQSFQSFMQFLDQRFPVQLWRLNLAIFVEIECDVAMYLWLQKRVRTAELQNNKVMIRYSLVFSNL